jgi:hypothetical protein
MNARLRASKAAGAGGQRPSIAAARAVTCMLSFTSGTPVDGRTCAQGRILGSRFNST